MIDGMTGPEGSRLPALNLRLLNSGKKFSKIKVYTARLPFFRILEILLHSLLEVSWNLNQEFWLWLNWKQAFLLKNNESFLRISFVPSIFSVPMNVLRKKPSNQKTISIRCFFFDFYIAEWTSEIRRDHEASLMHITAATEIRSFWNNTSEDLMLKLLCPLSLYVSKPLDQFNEGKLFKSQGVNRFIVLNHFRFSLT